MVHRVYSTVARGSVAQVPSDSTMVVAGPLRFVLSGALWCVLVINHDLIVVLFCDITLPTTTTTSTTIITSHSVRVFYYIMISSVIIVVVVVVVVRRSRPRGEEDDL